MHRIDTASVESDKFGTGKDGFTNGEPGVTNSTELDADVCNAWQEELCRVVEGAGRSLSKTNFGQVVQVLKRLQHLNHTELYFSAAADTVDFKRAAANPACAYPDSALFALLCGDDCFTFFEEYLYAYKETLAGTPGNLYGCAFDDSGNLLVAGASGYLGYKPAATGVWAQKTPAGSFSGTFYGCAHDQSALWCAVGADTSAEIQTSSDGTTWTARTPAGSYAGIFRDVCFGNSLWVAVGDSAEIQTSSDGTTWTSRAAAGSYTGNFARVIWSDYHSKFIAVGAGDAIQTSPDGITWTSVTGPSFSTTMNWMDVAVDDQSGMVILACIDVAYSFDLSTWELGGNLISNANGYGTTCIAIDNAHSYRSIAGGQYGVASIGRRL